MVPSVDRMSRSEAGAALLSSEGEGIAVTNRMDGGTMPTEPGKSLAICPNCSCRVGRPAGCDVREILIKFSALKGTAFRPSVNA